MASVLSETVATCARCGFPVRRAQATVRAVDDRGLLVVAHANCPMAVRPAEGLGEADHT